MPAVPARCRRSRRRIPSTRFGQTSFCARSSFARYFRPMFVHTVPPATGPVRRVCRTRGSFRRASPEVDSRTWGKKRGIRPRTVSRSPPARQVEPRAFRTAACAGSAKVETSLWMLSRPSRPLPRGAHKSSRSATLAVAISPLRVNRFRRRIWLRWDADPRPCGAGNHPIESVADPHGSGGRLPAGESGCIIDMAEWTKVFASMTDKGVGLRIAPRT